MLRLTTNGGLDLSVPLDLQLVSHNPGLRTWDLSSLT